MTSRLRIAEGVYRILGRDQVFWAELYRVAGFFAEREGDPERARTMREAALQSYEALLKDPSRAAYRKEDLLGAGAVAAKLGRSDLAITYLRAVKSARYDLPDWDPAGLRESRKELNALAAQILRSIR